LKLAKIIGGVRADNQRTNRFAMAATRKTAFLIPCSGPQTKQHENFSVPVSKRALRHFAMARITLLKADNA
jgi:hypothetical protein